MKLMRPDLNLDLSNGLHMRSLRKEDAALLAEATSREPAPSLWCPRPAGPYTLHDAQSALSAWDPAAGGRFSIGVLRGRRLLGAVGLMPDRPKHRTGFMARLPYLGPHNRSGIRCRPQPH